MNRILFLLAAAGLSSACSREPERTATPVTVTVGPAVTPAVTPGGSSSAPAEPVKATAAVPQEAKEAVVAARETVKDVQKDVQDLTAAVEASFSVEKLKALVASLDTQKLTDLAGKLLDAAQKSDGARKGLETELAKLSLTDLVRAGELRTKIESATGGLRDLKEKLGVVVEKLKASGVDVSKYAAFAGGGTK